jgi:hypothetical protein
MKFIVIFVVLLSQEPVCSEFRYVIVPIAGTISASDA